MSYRLLVVAGEHEILRALPGQFGDDIEVRLIETANDALWEVRSDPPEAIIAAVDLPGMSGLEMAEILPNFDVPTRVMLWSREPDHAAQKQAESYGIFRFLHGALSDADIQSVIHDAVRQAPTAATAAPVAPAPEVVRQEPEAPAPEPVVATPSERFTPARVRLPSPTSSASAPAAPPRSERLASRTRAAAERPAPAAERPAPAA